MSEITSEPAFTEELVTSLDFMFVGEVRLPITLRVGDTVEFRNGMATIHFDALSSPKGRIVVNMVHVLWYDEHQRLVKYPVKAPPPATGSTLPPAA